MSVKHFLDGRSVRTGACGRELPRLRFVRRSDPHVVILRFFGKSMHHAVIGPHNFISPESRAVAKIVLPFIRLLVREGPFVVIGRHRHDVVLVVYRWCVDALVIMQLSGFNWIVNAILTHEWHIGHHVIWK